jgi:GDPmannose 4,6-dehydratase
VTRALITGVNGQDGSYLAEKLLALGMEVHGTIRRASLPNLQRIEHLLPRSMLVLHYADLTDATSIEQVVQLSRPDYVFNLGAMSDVRISFDVPLYAVRADGEGPLALFDAVRRNAPEARVYQAGSSEMFGMNPDVPTNEMSMFYPGSPYAAAKVMAFHAAVNYREAYGLHISNGILFNHESERRGVEFVTRKIAIAAAEIATGSQRVLRLGSLTAKRDWGYAPEYVDAMTLMVDDPTPRDYVVATGETHTVAEFAERAFDYVGLNWVDHVVAGQDKLKRPTDPPILLGDPTKIETLLGWKAKTKFDDLVDIMVEAELERIDAGTAGGYV